MPDAADTATLADPVAAQPAAAPAPAATPAPAAAPAAASPTAVHAAAGDPLARVPEKHRVMQADGTLDVPATLAKNAEAYAALEKRLGSGDAPPATVADYKLTVPETFKESFKADDPGFKEYLAQMHAAGATQKQVDASMASFFNWAPKMIEAQQQYDIESCNGKLREVWKDDATFNGEWQSAIRAMKTFTGDQFDEFAGELGNNPRFVQLMARVGKELKEDKTVEGKTAPAGDIATLEAHPAYMDPKHPEHAAISARVRQHYQSRNR